VVVAIQKVAAVEWHDLSAPKERLIIIERFLYASRLVGMQEAAYYREHAAQARRLARLITNGDVEGQLLQMADEYDRIAEDLEKDAIEIRHPERMPQRQGS
jgi:hypothetical protein